jgi:lysophospholipase L1-like esterase
MGLNDCARIGRADGRPQLDADGFLFGLQQLLAQAITLAPVLVLGLTPVDEAMMPYADVLWYQLEQVRRYEALLEEACLEANVPFLPLLEPLLADPAWLQWLCSDGIHLNSEGHRQVYERVRHWPALLRWADLQPLAVSSSSV